MLQEMHLTRVASSPWPVANHYQQDKCTRELSALEACCRQLSRKQLRHSETCSGVVK